MPAFDVDLRLLPVHEPIRIELGGILPVRRVAPHSPRIDEDACVCRDVVAVDLRLLGTFVGNEQRRRWVQTECLFHDGVEVGQIGQVGFANVTISTDNSVEVGLQTVHHLWMA